IFFIIASLLVVKPVRNSLFLVNLGPAQLPFVFLLVAVFAGIGSHFYSKLTTKIPLNNLIRSTILLSIIVFMGFWIALGLNFTSGWIIYLFYIWVAFYGGIITTQFWLLAGYIFNARESKRLFGFVGAGAIMGGIAGGYLTTYLVPKIGTVNMLLLGIGFLGIAVLFQNMVWNRSARNIFRKRSLEQKRMKQIRQNENPFRLILKSKHLMYVAVIIGLSVVVANLVDYQFNTIASRAIPDEDKLTAFFGFWLSNMNIFSFLIQILLTRRVLQTFGVGPSLLALPVSILIGALAILIAPVLWAAVFIKVSDGSLKQSINKAARELLFLPLPGNIKNKTKAFIDVFVDSLATGLGGILLIVFVTGFQMPVGWVSLIIIALIGLWLFFIRKVRKEYINSFRLAIEKRTIDVEEETINLEDAAIFDNLLNILGSNNERQIVYVLNLLENVKRDEFIPYLQNLLNFPSGEIRELVFKILLKYDSVDLSEKALEFIGNESEEVRKAAMRYIFTKSSDKEFTLQQFLNNEDLTVRGTALILTAEELRENKKLKAQFDLREICDTSYRELLQKEKSEAKKNYLKKTLAEVTGTSNDPRLYTILAGLLEDDNIEVRRKAIVNAGKTRAQEFFPYLIRNLNERHVKKFAREALVDYGEEVIDDLVRVMQNPREEPGIRYAIPKVLALIGSQRSVDVLMENLKQDNPELRYETLKALNNLKLKFPLLKLDDRFLAERIREEMREYYQLVTIIYEQKKTLDGYNPALPDEENQERIQQARRLLVKALEEKLGRILERVFRLLGLKYQQDVLFNAYLGIRSQKPDLKANALEFLDNILDFNLKRLIIPVVESTSYQSLINKSFELFDFKVSTENECFTLLLNNKDIWLKSTTLFLMAELKQQQYAKIIGPMMNDADALIRETAKYAMEKVGEAV
ncbi:MAG: Npt1/Npt2 family nucleotide transporter, partial [Calditrichia bacterium]